MKLQEGEQGKKRRVGPPRWGIEIRHAAGEVLWFSPDVTRRSALDLMSGVIEDGFRGHLPGDLLVTIGHTRSFQHLHTVTGERVEGWE